MSKKVKIIIAISVFVLFIIGAVVAYNALTQNATPTTNNESSETVKQAAPNFVVVDTEGNSQRLSDFKGKPVVLNFWASWCPPCKEEMPIFQKVYDELGNDVQFMMVDLTDGQRETEEIGLSYIKEQGYTFPIFFDTKQDAAIAYGIQSIPTTFFIDAEGNIVTAVQGAANEATLREGISLINK